jgi:hypothetical protein
MRWWEHVILWGGVVLNLASAWLNNRSRRRLETAQRRFHPGVRPWQQDVTHRDVWPLVGHTEAPMSGTDTSRDNGSHTA